MINLSQQQCISLLIIFIFVVLTNQVHAEEYSCPSIESIKSRTISKDFDWTVSEETTLNQVLNVSELVEVSIENNGEFIGCIYQSDKNTVRLDAKPITVDCLVVSSSDNWLLGSGGQSICNESNKMQCKFDVSCQMKLNES